MRRYLTEFIGTCFLVLTIGLVSASGQPLAAVAIGSILMVMIYMGGHISGGHYNPAVTLAVFIRGKLKGSDVLPYMAMQLLGAMAGAAMAWSIAGRTFAPAPGLTGANASAIAIAVELLFTFALCLVVLNVATAKATEGNSYYGLAIGFTVTAAALAGGGYSGGAFNPAVGVGPALVHLMNGGSAAYFWIYLIGPFAGAIIAAFVFRVQHAGQLEERAPAERAVKAPTPAGPADVP